MRSEAFLQVYLVAGVMVVVTFPESANAFKLPVEARIKENIDPWTDMKSYGGDEGVQQEAINSIPISRRRPVKHSESGEVPRESEGLPVLISFRNLGDQLEDGTVRYETDTPRRLERFYKHSDHSEPTTGERIIFPNEESNDDNARVKTVKQEDDELRLENRSKDRRPGSPSASEESSDSNKAPNRTQDHVAVEPTANANEDKETAQTQMNENGRDGSSSLEISDVQDQSLYSGPKLRASGSGSCPEGYKKNRNGACQKPSRRLLNVSN